MLSGEWTLGAVNLLKNMAVYYRDHAEALRREASHMRQAVTRDLLVESPHGPALKYANKRYFIPFGWYANPVPSAASTAWAILEDEDYNVFRLGGAYGTDDIDVVAGSAEVGSACALRASERCQGHLDFAWGTGMKSNPEWYKDMKRYAGVDASDATKEDLQKFFVCAKTHPEDCAALQFPRECSRPPCDVCEGMHLAPASWHPPHERILIHPRHGKSWAITEIDFWWNHAKSRYITDNHQTGLGSAMALWSTTKLYLLLGQLCTTYPCLIVILGGE